MSNRFIEDILAEYEKSRSKAEKIALSRQLEIYNKIPRIKSIDEELASMGIEIARCVLKKNADINSLIEKLHQKSIDLKVEKGELLAQNGYTLDYASPKYSCSDCKDTGYRGTKKCHCFKQKIIDMLYNQSNLKNVLEKENFDTFIFDYYSDEKFEDRPVSPRKNIENIFSACINFVRDFDVSSENLFFYGNSGLGKTFLSNCIAKDLLDKEKLVIYQTAANLIELLKEAKFDTESEYTKSKYDNIFECELLIIDDLGTEYITEFSQMELYNIINSRLLSGRKMLISTNLSLDNIYNTYSERIVSRIFGNFTAYNFYGSDIRIKIAEQKRKKNKK